MDNKRVIDALSLFAPHLAGICNVEELCFQVGDEAQTETSSMAIVLPVAGSSPLKMDFEFCSIFCNSPTSSYSVLFLLQDVDNRLLPLNAFSSGVPDKVESDSLS